MSLPQPTLRTALGVHHVFAIGRRHHQSHSLLFHFVDPLPELYPLPSCGVCRVSISSSPPAHLHLLVPRRHSPPAAAALLPSDPLSPAGVLHFLTPARCAAADAQGSSLSRANEWVREPAMIEDGERMAFGWDAYAITTDHVAFLLNRRSCLRSLYYLDFATSTFAGTHRRSGCRRA
ncbi:hypothetical protein GALMADRAFT_147130 [Galerina marginata CBS 339.88]|uniref:Uncharacterized protein n=1 Tax=Galerina marginata (strain CBS 339.88) TaxID=685588 RepID=A0A067SBJ6_GALM3|nr:hypothetical protein GALMADRAFT_147130 [Galerina marginata CBS 339.88]